MKKSLQQQIVPIVKKASEIIAISTDQELKQAVTLLSELNKFNDKIIEEREKITKPLNEALKAERARWKPIELQNQEAIASIRTKMTEYQTALIKQRTETEQSITDRVAPGKGHLSLETAVKKLGAIPEVETEHSTDAGLVQFRQKQQLKVTDLEKIPKAYFDLNEAKLLKDLKEGVVVPGAEIEIIQVPVNYR